MRKILHVEGMGCQNCVKHVTEALEGLDGVSKAEVSLEKNLAVVEMTREISDDVLKTAVEDAGYDVSKIEAA